MTKTILADIPFSAELSGTPWNDRILGGPTAHLTLSGIDAYAASVDLAQRSDWLPAMLAKRGLVYVSTHVSGDDHLGKAVVQQLGFDFVYQTTTCLLRLTPTLSLTEGHADFVSVDPASVDADEVAAVCAATLKHGRFCEDWLTQAEAGPRNTAFIRDLHVKQGVHRVFTRSATGALNGYAYIPIDGGSADLLLMGIDEKHAPPGGGKVFWEICLAELRNRRLARRVHTRVPAANLGVLNIYAKIGFTFVGPSYDFRMFPQRSAG